MSSSASGAVVAGGVLAIALESVVMLWILFKKGKLK